MLTCYDIGERITTLFLSHYSQNTHITLDLLNMYREATRANAIRHQVHPPTRQMSHRLDPKLLRLNTCVGRQ